MRTPNTECIICAKPLYRRPFELAKVRYAACMDHRAKAQSVFGVTEAQAAGLSLGASLGGKARLGYKHREDTKAKASASHKKWCAENPEKVAERSAKRRGENAYNWNGGSTRLNVMVRQLHENRKWINAVKARDGQCLRCGSTANLEAHHIIELADLIEKHGIKTADEARETPELWDLENGETLCRPCHYAHHGRIYSEAA
jgi:5-methylcytosine-specific restriction endonuclease McrA